MKEEELNKAIETNSLWENLVQLTDSLEDYSIFHQVISRNQKENTMDILFVASKLTDINSYTSIIKNAGLNSSFIVRKISSGIGVERTFQMHSPLIDSIAVKRKGDVRKAKLYYLRERSGRSARIKERLD